MLSRSGNTQSYDIGAVFTKVGPGQRKRGKAKRGGGRRGDAAYPTGMRREFVFDMEKLGAVMRMFYDVPGFQFARRAMQARVFCGEFLVHVKNWPGVDGETSRTFGEDAQGVVRTHWMPAIKEIYDYKESWGFCPYVWESIPNTTHYYPRVPVWGTYFLSYEEDRYGREFRLYWIDGVKPEVATDVFWVRTDQEPINGELRTAVAALFTDYDLYLTNLSCHKQAMVNQANPYSIIEYAPRASSDLAEINDTRVMFGAQAALASLQDVEHTRNARQGIRRDYLVQALHRTYEMNYGAGWPDGSDSMSDPDQQALQETHGRFLQRLVHLNADYHYRPAAASGVVMAMPDIWRKLNQDAANSLGFPLEFAQAQSAQRAANVQGNTRYLNENAKQMIRSYTSIVKDMWLASPYGRIIHRLNKLKERAAAEELERAAREQKKSLKGKGKKKEEKKKDDDDGEDQGARIPRVGAIREPGPKLMHELRKQIDVEIEFSCVPEMTYQQLRELVLDKVISHKDFIKLAGDIFGLPESTLNTKTNEKLMEEEQMEMAKRDARHKWKHEDEALKWHEYRAKMPAGEEGEGGGAAITPPPRAAGAGVSIPSRASKPHDRKKSSESATGAN